MPVILTALALLMATAQSIQIGSVLPHLEGEYLTKRKAVLPDDARGKVALLAFGFSPASQTSVESWTKPFSKKYKGNPRVTFFAIPMIGSMGKVAAPFILGGMRKGNPKEQWENLITVFGGTDSWKEGLHVKSDEESYVVLLDSQGVIRYLTSGSYSDARFADFTKKVDELAGNP
jgi:hypothetical protein